ncbi:hypothetical protein COJ15_21605 [Bacillus thuringiensis]|uniref:Uncharacterized protein n=1 Tax=Bacillus thuringiensis TaxID=1428 RepID=A0A9X6ZSD0_BACTU|nr:hypothetical protein COJ15_21605 [Bacillus thuringiensis]
MEVIKNITNCKAKNVLQFFVMVMRKQMIEIMIWMYGLYFKSMKYTHPLVFLKLKSRELFKCYHLQQMRYIYKMKFHFVILKKHING